jgi:dTDP-4-dehydrorhamnose 3,5-epimerase
MNIIKTKFSGLFIIEPQIFADERGYFFESYNENNLSTAGIKIIFVQDNQSFSYQGVIRGLHFQKPPYAQTKLIRVLEGVIYDVAVDLRAQSTTFGQWFGIELSAENKKQLLIPQGFAHGFSVISKHAAILYKCDNFYDKQSEDGILYNDPTLAIDWKLETSDIIVSEKDKILPVFDKTKIYF